MKRNELIVRLMFVFGALLPLFIIVLVRAVDADIYSIELQQNSDQKSSAEPIEDSINILSELNDSYEALFATNDYIHIEPLTHQMTAKWLKAIHDLKKLVAKKAPSLVPIVNKLESINHSLILVLGANYKMNIEGKETNMQEVGQYLKDQLKGLSKESEEIVSRLKRPRIRIKKGSPKDLIITFGTLLYSAINDHILPKAEKY